MEEEGDHVVDKILQISRDEGKVQCSASQLVPEEVEVDSAAQFGVCWFF
mgnify:CR=1 FL=1